MLSDEAAESLYDSKQLSSALITAPVLPMLCLLSVSFSLSYVAAKTGSIHMTSAAQTMRQMILFSFYNLFFSEMDFRLAEMYCLIENI